MFILRQIYGCCFFCIVKNRESSSVLFILKGLSSLKRKVKRLVQWILFMQKRKVKGTVPRVLYYISLQDCFNLTNIHFFKRFSLVLTEQVKSQLKKWKKQNVFFSSINHYFYDMWGGGGQLWGNVPQKMFSLRAAVNNVRSLQIGLSSSADSAGIFCGGMLISRKQFISKYTSLRPIKFNAAYTRFKLNLSIFTLYIEFNLFSLFSNKTKNCCPNYKGGVKKLHFISYVP